MKLHLKKIKKHKFKEISRLNPRHYWLWLLCSTILLVSIELFYFSWFFIKTTDKLDAPAIPTLETNSVQINRMKSRLDAVEKAIQERTGATQNS
jgi:hypothetical protein